jgi:hypothetical protein
VWTNPLNVEALPVCGFMHVAMRRHWRRIVDDQLMKMRASGLWERTERLYVGLLGPEQDVLHVDHPKIEVVRLGSDFNRAERPTLAMLQDLCRSRDCLVFYVHTKGVFRTCPGQEQWRHAMEHFVIQRHRDCIEALRDHDACGINWHRSWCGMFRGNFWWATSRYVRTLPDVRRLEPLRGLEVEPRMVCERWIGENPAVRVACPYDTGVDHYVDQPLPRSRYAKLREVETQEGTAAGTWAGLENRFQDLLEPVERLELVVAVGVEGPGDARYFTQAVPDAAVWAVRLADGDGTLAKRRPDPVDSQRNPRAALGLIRYPIVHVLDATTASEAAERVPDGIDVLHIGGGVTHQALPAFWSCWERKVRVGGCVLLHDTVARTAVGKFFRSLRGRTAEIRDHRGLGAWYKLRDHLHDPRANGSIGFVAR